MKAWVTKSDGKGGFRGLKTFFQKLDLGFPFEIREKSLGYLERGAKRGSNNFWLERFWVRMVVPATMHGGGQDRVEEHSNVFFIYAFSV